MILFDTNNPDRVCYTRLEHIMVVCREKPRCCSGLLREAGKPLLEHGYLRVSFAPVQREGN
jgi:hypothetical protein